MALCRACTADPANVDWVSGEEELGDADDAATFASSMSYADLYREATKAENDLSDDERRLLDLLVRNGEREKVERVDARGHRRGAYYRLPPPPRVRWIAEELRWSKSKAHRERTRLFGRLRAIPQRR